MEVEDYHRYVRDHFATWKGYGRTLMCDGWTSNNGWHIVNFMAYFVIGTIFIRLVNTSRHCKDAQYLHSLIKEMLHGIAGWEEYVVQVMTDNTTIFKTAGKCYMRRSRILFRCHVRHIVLILC